MSMYQDGSQGAPAAFIASQEARDEIRKVCDEENKKIEEAIKVIRANWPSTGSFERLTAALKFAIKLMETKKGANERTIREV